MYHTLGILVLGYSHICNSHVQPHIIIFYDNNLRCSIYVYFVQRGWTSLMKASFEGHDEIVEVLLVGGAKPDSTGLVRCSLSLSTVRFMKVTMHANLIWCSTSFKQS